MNGDLALDIAVGNEYARSVVLFNDGDGNVGNPVNFGEVNDLTNSVALGDINNDGYLDIVTGNNTVQNVVYLNDGDGTFDTTIVNFGTGSDGTLAVALGDLNGDGSLDIAVGNAGEQSVVYFNGLPEISVEGNSTEIVNGDGSPSSADHTDFGNVAVPGSMDRIFTIKNSGAAPAAPDRHT